MKVKVAQSCPTLCNPMDYTVCGILQARILEWVAFPFCRESFQPRGWTQVSHIAGRFFAAEPQGKPRTLEWIAYPFSRGFSWSRNWTRVSCMASGFFTKWSTREALTISLVFFNLVPNRTLFFPWHFLLRKFVFKVPCTLNLLLYGVS